MDEGLLSKKITEYQKLAKEDPHVNVNLLMASALADASKQDKQSAGRSFRWPYMISLGLPPLGLIYAVKFFFSDDDSERYAARVCLILTIIAILLVVGVSKLLFSSSGVSVDQLQQIKPSDIYQLGQ